MRQGGDDLIYITMACKAANSLLVGFLTNAYCVVQSILKYVTKVRLRIGRCLL